MNYISYTAWPHTRGTIIQNFVPKPQTIMGKESAPERTYFARTVALARIMMPSMNIQIPPNLSPGMFGEFLHAGINDWGGISPVTPDFVNPEMPWPSIRMRYQRLPHNLNQTCRFASDPESQQTLDHCARTEILYHESIYHDPILGVPFDQN